MPDRTINFGDSETDARYRIQDTSSTGGDFVIAEDLDGGTVLLEYDYSAGEFVSRGPVNLNGNDITDAGSVSAATLEAGSINGEIKLVDPTDGHTAVENAIDDLPAASGLIVLTEGTAIWSDAVTLDKQGLTVVGLGQAPTHLRRTGGGDVFDVTADFVTISDIRFSGDRSVGPHSALNVSGSNFTAERLRISDFDKGIRINAGFEHSLVNVRGRDCVTSFVEADGGNDLDMSMCFYDTTQDGTAEPTEACLHIINMDAVQTEDCDFIRGTSGIKIAPTSGNVSQHHKFEGGYLADSGNGPGIHLAGEGDIREVTFGDAWIATHKRGVYADQTNTIESIIFRDCDIHNHQNEGASILNDNTRDIRFVGCTFAGNDRSDVGANDIFLNTTDDATIRENKFGNYFGHTTIVNANVFVQSGSTATTVVDNEFGGSASGNAVDDFASDTKVRHNEGWATENSGNASVSDGDTIAHGLDGTPTYVNLTTSVQGHIAAASAVDGTNITVELVDNTGTAITTDETVYWEAKSR